MINSYCACFANHSINSYIPHWKAFLEKPNTYAIIDSQSNPVSPINGNSFIYTEADVRKNLKFPHEVSKQHYWNAYGNRNIIWFYAYLRMLNFYKANPNFDYYWFFDDDILCNDWDAFFKDVKYDSDFLSYFIFKNAGITEQPLVPLIDNNTHSGTDWFRRYPGPTDTMPADVKDIFGSFFAITRYSNEAFKALLDFNDAGYFGYGEGFVPTMLNHVGFKLDSLYSPDNTSRHFDVSKVNILHKNQIVNWQWI